MITQVLLNKYKVNIDEESLIVEKAYSKVLDEYMEELDEVVLEVENIIKDIEEGVIDKYSNEDLEKVAIKIPLLMYKIGGDLERVGLKMDVANSLKDYKQNEVLLGSIGTVAAKKAKGENESTYEELMENLYKRVYRQIDRRLSYIDNLYNSIKKVLSLRIVELEVFRRENANNNTVGGDK